MQNIQFSSALRRPPCLMQVHMFLYRVFLDF